MIKLFQYKVQRIQEENAATAFFKGLGKGFLQGTPVIGNLLKARDDAYASWLTQKGFREISVMGEIITIEGKQCKGVKSFAMPLGSNSEAIKITLYTHPNFVEDVSDGTADSDASPAAEPDLDTPLTDSVLREAVKSPSTVLVAYLFDAPTSLQDLFKILNISNTKLDQKSFERFAAENNGVWYVPSNSISPKSVEVLTALNQTLQVLNINLFDADLTEVATSQLTKLLKSANPSKAGILSIIVPALTSALQRKRLTMRQLLAISGYAKVKSFLTYAVSTAPTEGNAKSKLQYFADRYTSGAYADASVLRSDKQSKRIPYNYMELLISAAIQNRLKKGNY
jgi:hypothetical protein